MPAFDRMGASLRYTVTASCETIAVRHAAAESCGELALAPGDIADDSGLSCFGQGKELVMSSCSAQMSEQVAVELEECRRPLCAEGAGRPAGVWTSTTKQADPSAAHAGETIAYTITFANHSPYTLEAVYIFDAVPAEITVAPGSIHPAPKPGETLPGGIFMGRVAPEHSVVLSYRAIVGSGTSGMIVNRARAEYCYADCNGCLRHGVGSCKSSVVQIIPEDSRITITKSADKESVCRVGEEIVYTLVVSNPGSVAVADVIATDHIPPGLCYKENSTGKNGGPPVNESPQDGIAVGALNPGQSYAIVFTLVVCTGSCCGAFPGDFVNTATATGRAGTAVVSAVSSPVTVEMKGGHSCQCVQKCLSVCDFCRFRYCYIYYLGTACHDTANGRMVVARFGIAVKYVDCNGENRGRSCEGTVVFRNLPADFDRDRFRVRFSDLICCARRCGKITARFRADLQYCRGT